MLTQDKISDALCDMYDIRRQARVSGFNLLPKDPDDSMFSAEEIMEADGHLFIIKEVEIK